MEADPQLAGNPLRAPSESDTNPLGMTCRIASAYLEMEEKNWSKAAELFSDVLSEHARIGGSNAQRDLIDFSLAACLVRDGRLQEARTVLKITRPRALTVQAIDGF